MICKMCNQRDASGHSYGALCCGACKMFFRRSLFVQNVTKCTRGGECVLKCRNCRFQRCIEAGMGFVPTENLHKVQCQSQLSAMIFNLIYQEEHRESQLFNCQYIGDPTIEELALVDGPLSFVKRPPDFFMDLREWVFITGMTSLNHIKKFHHVNMVNNADRVSLLKYSFFDFSLFSDAMRARERNQEYICFPDGTDVIIPGAVGLPESKFNDVRCRLASRVNELKLTKEEYLLLSLLFTANPSLPNISPSGRGIINSFQEVYKSALLQHCMVEHGRNGPARFQELLSLLVPIYKTRLGIGEVFLMNAIQRPAIEMNKIFRFD